MLDKNTYKIMQLLGEKDLVLDIGGWAQPFNRADFVVDIHPYETRGFFGSQGGNKEYFNKKTWILHDSSSKKKLPFKDKKFDFVICSHTLEDIRDPIFLCSEIIRVGKKGYIEVPSEKLELTKGLANNYYCGYYHHRWLVNIAGSIIRFRFKPHFIHNNWKFHFPKSFLKKLLPSKRVSYLFWDCAFDYAEIIQISRDKIEGYIENLIKREGVYPQFYYSLDLFKNKIFDLFKKLKFKLNRNSYYHRYMDTKEYISR